MDKNNDRSTLYINIFEGKAIPLNEVKRDNVIAVGVFDESVFAKDRNGYTHLTFLESPYAAENPDSLNTSEGKRLEKTVLIAETGLKVGVPKPKSGSYLDKPFQTQNINEMITKIISLKEFVLPVYSKEDYEYLKQIDR